MRLFFIPSFLISLVLLAACLREAAPTTVLPVIEPSITDLAVPKIDQTTADTIRQNLALFLKSNPYTEYEAGNQLLMYLVSSGEFGRAEITLARGETCQADVLYAYTLMSSQRVLVVPVVVGLTLPDNRYAYFSEKRLTTIRITHR